MAARGLEWNQRAPFSGSRLKSVSVAAAFSLCENRRVYSRCADWHARQYVGHGLDFYNFAVCDRNLR